MRRLITVLVAAVTVITAVAGTSLAQNSTAASLWKPLVITLEQSTPVNVTLAIPSDKGTIVTTTVPLTISTNLQIAITGGQVVSVTRIGAQTPLLATISQPAAESGKSGASSQPEQAAAPAETQTDAAGVPYSVQAPEGLELLQVSSKNTFGNLMIVGQLRNTASHPFKFILLSAPLYDADGKLVDVGNGAATATTLEPGAKTTFTVITTASADRVARYELQVEASE